MVFVIHPHESPPPGVRRVRELRKALEEEKPLSPEDQEYLIRVLRLIETGENLKAALQLTKGQGRPKDPPNKSFQIAQAVHREKEKWITRYRRVPLKPNAKGVSVFEKVASQFHCSVSTVEKAWNKNRDKVKRRAEEDKRLAERIRLLISELSLESRRSTLKGIEMLNGSTVSSMAYELASIYTAGTLSELVESLSSIDGIAATRARELACSFTMSDALSGLDGLSELIKARREADNLEKRVRRRAKRSGLFLRKSRIRNPDHPDFGGYRLQTHEGRYIGDSEHAVSLEDIAILLEEQEQSR